MSDARKLTYPAAFEPDPAGGFCVSFRDIPEALTQGETIEEAREMAADALATAMEFYFEDRRPVPWPSARRQGEYMIDVPPEVSAAVLQLNEDLKDGR
jgi:antitoxin HicB